MSRAKLHSDEAVMWFEYLASLTTCLVPFSDWVLASSNDLILISFLYPDLLLSTLHLFQ